MRFENVGKIMDRKIEGINELLKEKKLDVLERRYMKSFRKNREKETKLYEKIDDISRTMRA